MNDTPDEVQAEFRRRLMALDPSGRLRMVSGMFDTARALVRSGHSMSSEDAEPARLIMFRRLYGRDFEAEELAVISERLRRALRGGSSASSSDS